MYTCPGLESDPSSGFDKVQEESGMVADGAPGVERHNSGCRIPGYNLGPNPRHCTGDHTLDHIPLNLLEKNLDCTLAVDEACDVVQAGLPAEGLFSAEEASAGDYP